MTRPNILFIMTDEQKWDTFSYNNPKIKTPNLDALIQDSVFFNNAYCSNPSCIPSRAGIVTGKFPTACECPTFITKLPEYEKTFMTKLQESGYYTSVVGKQHFAHSPIYKGYDFEEIIDGHSPNGIPSEIVIYTNYLKEHGMTSDQLFNNDLIIGGEWFGDIKYHIDWFIGEEGKKWLQNHYEATKHEETSRPWFFNLSFPGPHQPYDGEGTEFADLYDLEDMERPESVVGDLDQKPPHYKKLNPRAYIDQYPDETFRRTKRAYYANMSLIDQKVGEVIRILKETGQYDNTMIIFSTDHGDFMGDFGMVSKAQYLAEGLMHVPLFVKPPIKDFKGYEVNDYVTNIDIASTCLTVANATGKITQNMENHPYSDYWEKETVEPREYVYMEAHDLKGTIEDGIKVVYYVERAYGEIYDLKNDLAERVNLWDEEAYQPAKMKAMGRMIDKLFRLSPKSNIAWNIYAPKI